MRGQGKRRRRGSLGGEQSSVVRDANDGLCLKGASSCTEGQGMAGCLESKLSVSLFFGKQKQGGALEGGAV